MNYETTFTDNRTATDMWTHEVSGQQAAAVGCRDATSPGRYRPLTLGAFVWLMLVVVHLLICATAASAAPVSNPTSEPNKSYSQVFSAPVPAPPTETPIPNHYVFLPLITNKYIPIALPEYPVLGSPYAIAVESPSRAWFTLPERNTVGRITLTPSGWETRYYPIPTENAEPYDIAYAAGLVWFTERSANKIGVLEPVTGVITEYTIPTSDSKPSGIAVLPGSPIQVWFTERAGNQISRLTVTDPANYTFDEYALPHAGSQPESVFIVSADRIWFTAPGVSRIGRLTPSLWPQSNAVVTVPTGSGSRPWTLHVDADGYPWFTDVAGNRIGQFFPQTVATITWHPLPNPASEPFDLTLGGGAVWYTGRSGNRVGQFVPQTSAFHEISLPGRSPTGIALDGALCAWITEAGAQRIARWCKSDNLLATAQWTSTANTPDTGAARLSVNSTDQPSLPSRQVAPVIPTSLPTYQVWLPVITVGSEQAQLFGVQTYGLLHNPVNGLSMVEQIGAVWIRTALAWFNVEPENTTPSGYRFGDYDRSFLAAHQAGLQPIVTVYGNPKWAATYLNGPIDKVGIDEFVEFMKAAVERYDGDGVADAPGSPVIDYWEFYNEPDSGDLLRAEYGQAYWGHFGAQYAKMLCRVYPAMKAASPRVKIVFGGIAFDWFEEGGGPFVRSFLTDVLRAGGGKCFDVMNFHYYPLFAPVWKDYGPGLVGKATYLRTQLAPYGLSAMPFVVTEMGWHSDGNSTPENQASYVVKLFAQAFAARLDAATWWTLMDLEPVYGGYGLFTRQGEPKLAVTAYQVAMQQLRSATYDRSLSASDLTFHGVEGHLFRRPAPLYVIWSEDSTPRVATIPAARVRIKDMLGVGMGELLDAGDGKIDGYVTVKVTERPLYVEVIP